MKKLKKLLALTVLTAISLTTFNCIKDKGSDTLPKYTVTFNTNGGNEMPNIQITEGEKVTRPIDPTREGYRLVEWREEGKTTAFDFNTAITYDITLKAVWIIKQVTITFDTDGGNEMEPSTINYKESVTKPEDPTKGIEVNFLEWRKKGETTKFDFNTPITEDITLIAIWSDKEVFIVTFDNDDGGILPVVEERVPEGEKATKPTTDPTKEGHDFVEWRKEGETTAFNFDTPITADITLKAFWNKKKYTVTFDADNGNEVKSIEVLYGDKVTKPTDPTKSEYNFVGWQLEGQTFDFNITPITASITLKAIWSNEQLFTITFDTDGGTPPIVERKVPEGEKVTAPTPTKEGHTFVEWQTGRRNYSL